MKSILGSRLMVGQQTLDLYVRVRFFPPQLKNRRRTVFFILCAAFMR